MQAHSALWVGDFCGVRLSQRARALRFRPRIRSRHAEGLIGVLVDEDVDVGLAEFAEVADEIISATLYFLGGEKALGGAQRLEPKFGRNS